MTRHYDAVVIGMGPAGMAAAITLAGCNVRTAVVDETARPGGQIYRQPPEAFVISNDPFLNRRRRKGRQLIAQFSAASRKLDLFLKTTVWGFFEPDRLTLIREGRLLEIRFRRLIIAEGAQERIIPFPGWTLPGIMTVGGLQKMLLHQRLLPGGRILLAGSHPLLFTVASQIVRIGADVAGVYQAVRPVQMLPMVFELLRQPHMLGESCGYMGTLLKSGTPVRFGWGIVSARGRNRVEAVTLARLDHRWRPLPGTETTLPVDTVALNNGFLPGSRIARLCGCRMIYDRRQQSTRPEVDSFQRSSREKIYVAGDTAGIGGADSAEIQGRIAGLHAALSMGRLTDGPFNRLVSHWQDRRCRSRRWAKVLDRIFTHKSGLLEIMDRETVVCRCEGVTAGQIWDEMDDGIRSLTELKSTRFAMGYCQGRICESIVFEMLRRSGSIPEESGQLKLRPPLCPIPAPVFGVNTKKMTDL